MGIALRNQMSPRTDVPAFHDVLREAAFSAASADDVAEIVKAMGAKAKKGDVAAAKLYLQLFAGLGPRDEPIRTQNNTQINVVPPRTAARQGTREKLSVLAERAKNGTELFREDDGEVDLE